jgi:ATP-dependent protease HslVU (ClpYQ) peptidase subunit
MTCIVGMVENGKVYIGGDSASVSGSDCHIREDQKVFQNGDMIFGFTSSFRMGQLLQYSLKIPDHDPRVDDFKYLCTDFMDAVIKCFKDKGYARNDNGEIEGGQFLLGYKGNLYMIASDFQVAKIKTPFDSVGCGMYYAIGALYILNKDSKLSAEEKMLRALEVAESNSAGVRKPFNIVSL